MRWALYLCDALLTDKVNIRILQYLSSLKLGQHLAVVADCIKRLHWELGNFLLLQNLRLKTKHCAQASIAVLFDARVAVSAFWSGQIPRCRLRHIHRWCKLSLLLLRAFIFQRLRLMLLTNLLAWFVFEKHAVGCPLKVFLKVLLLSESLAPGRYWFQTRSALCLSLCLKLFSDSLILLQYGGGLGSAQRHIIIFVFGARRHRIERSSVLDKLNALGLVQLSLPSGFINWLLSQLTL